MLRLVVCLVSVACISAYSSGSPNSGCNNLQPNHDGAVTQDAKTSPYKILIEGDTLGNWAYMPNGGSVKGKLINIEECMHAIFKCCLSPFCSLMTLLM